jgi:hypothetical protein
MKLLVDYQIESISESIHPSWLARVLPKDFFKNCVEGSPLSESLARGFVIKTSLGTFSFEILMAHVMYSYILGMLIECGDILGESDRQITNYINSFKEYTE